MNYWLAPALIVEDSPLVVDVSSLIMALLVMPRILRPFNTSALPSSSSSPQCLRPPPTYCTSVICTRCQHGFEWLPIPFGSFSLKTIVSPFICSHNKQPYSFINHISDPRSLFRLCHDDTHFICSEIKYTVYVIQVNRFYLVE